MAVAPAALVIAPVAWASRPPGLDLQAGRRHRGVSHALARHLQCQRREMLLQVCQVFVLVIRTLSQMCQVAVLTVGTRIRQSMAAPAALMAVAAVRFPALPH